MTMTDERPAARITRTSPRDLASQFSGRMYKEAYSRGLSLSGFLETLDPSSEYSKDDNPNGLDAFERVLREQDIVTQSIPDLGLRASTWDECTNTPEKRALMPELMARYYRQARSMPIMGNRSVLLSGDVSTGSLANPWYDNPEIRAKRLVPPIPLDAIVARTTPIDTDSYRTIYISDDLGTDAYRLKRVAEAAEIPGTTVITAEHTLRLHKFGRALRASYEQLRRQRVDRIAFIVARMALQAEADKVAIVENTIVNGDGNANTSAGTTDVHTLDPTITLTSTPQISLTAWLNFKLKFSLTYAPDVVIGQAASVLPLLTLPIGIGAGVMPLALVGPNAFGVAGPMNDQLAGGIRYGLDTNAPAGKLIAFQSDITVERVQEIGGNVSEVERFINNQTQLLTLTEVEGYGIIDPNAARVLTMTT